MTDAGTDRSRGGNVVAVGSLLALVLALIVVRVAHGLMQVEATDLIFSQAGTMPIILTAPHAGSVEVPGVPRRTTGTTSQDLRTREITETITSRLEALFCTRPYVVIANFHRRYIDANRPEAEAFEHPDARPYYVAYHERIRSFVDEVRQRYPEGAVLVDVHGQSEAPDTIHRGAQNGRTVKHLLERHGAEALIGRKSIFGQLQGSGYKVFPPNTPLGNPVEDRKWNGGYTVDAYGSHHPNGVDAIQIEIGSNFRGEDAIPKLSVDLADAIATFYEAYVREQPRCIGLRGMWLGPERSINMLARVPRNGSSHPS